MNKIGIFLLLSAQLKWWLKCKHVHTNIMSFRILQCSQRYFQMVVHFICSNRLHVMRFNAIVRLYHFKNKLKRNTKPRRKLCTTIYDWHRILKKKKPSIKTKCLASVHLSFFFHYSVELLVLSIKRKRKTAPK